MNGFCRKLKKFVEISPQLLDSQYSLLICSECGLISTTDQSNDHVWGLPDWFVEWVLGKENYEKERCYDGERSC